MLKTFFYVLFAGFLLVANFRAFTTPASYKEGDQPAMLNYCWFTDEHLSNPTGTWGEIATEIARLSNLYPGYTFTNESSSSLVEFEYGYFQGHPVVIIYSDLCPNLSDKK